MSKLKWPNLDGILPEPIEKQYRQYFLRTDVRQAAIAIAFFVVPTVVLAYNDFKFLAPGPLLYSVLAFRAAYFIFSLAIAASLRRIRDSKTFDHWIFVFSTCGVLLVTFINCTRPPDYTGGLMIDICLILILYLGTPIKLNFRVLAAGAFTVSGTVLILIFHRELPPNYWLPSLFALYFTNAAGIMISHRLYSYRRSQFRTSLEMAREMEERLSLSDKVNDLYQREKCHREQLQEETRAKSQFIDVLAHELRTPLTPILSSSELLQERLKGNPDPLLQNLADNISTSSEVLAGRLEDLLELARYSRGAYKLSFRTIDVTDFFRKVVSRFKPSLDKAQQHLNLRIESGLSEFSMDASRIEQVMVNLLSNASKYSPVGSLISLSVKGMEKGLWIEVQDEGRGISREDQQCLFEPYRRLQIDGRVPGLGLGLSICKQIIDAHNGKIWVNSLPSKGSTFGFWLPAKTVLDMDQQEKQNHILRD